MLVEADDINPRLDNLEKRLEKIEGSLQRKRWYEYLSLGIILVYVFGLAFYFYEIYSFTI